eukprot:249722_1
MALRRTLQQCNGSFTSRYANKALCYHTSTRFSTLKTATSYANPSNASEGYEIVNSIEKPVMPAFGFGTWGVNHFSNEVLAQSVDCALRLGYKHLDCARVYANEVELGEIIHDHLDKGTLSRSELFVTSKLFNNEHDEPGRALELTLKDLQLDYVDCFLIHWPFRNMPNTTDPEPFNINQFFDSYKLLHELMVQGLTRSVGVCNATVHKMKQLNALCDAHGVAKPGNLQVELHPYLQQDHLLRFCAENDIVVTSAMPLGSPERPARCRRDDDPIIMEDPALVNVAKETGYSIAQVIIRWHLQKGVVCIPKATEEWMIKQNLETLDFVLSDEHMAKINAMDRRFRLSRAEFLGWRADQPWEEMWDYED